ncbi:MAG: DUF2769 domain-containing protein [Candidatus Altiarchaeota archaeon]
MGETFEEKMEQMAELSDEEVAERIEELKDVCKSYCGECPSYTGTDETELGFCAIGRSENITEEKGCLCGSCPITEKMSLRWSYYCTRGAGREQAATE